MRIKSAVKRLAWTMVPGYMADRNIRHVAALERQSPWMPWVDVERVEGGPFAGMAYPAEARPWIWAPQLRQSGTYEQPLVEKLVDLLPDTTLFVDVGAADGYYLIGIARRYGIPCVGYESSRIQRRNLRRTAEENGVSDLVAVRGHCRALSRDDWPDVAGMTLILMDVEGAEDDLLDEATVASLGRDVALAVELHEFARPGVTDRVTGRLAATHDIEIVVGEIEPGRHETPRWAIFQPKSRPTVQSYG